MDNAIFLPKKIRVGFQNRSDTYTGKLAYVIYYDAKGKLRKETSWEGWRDHNIEPEEFDNVPTEGFVLNKKVGGYRYEWDPRQTYVRVYDPRGFEFEITIPNLLHILENTSSIKGKGLEGEFVYGWDGKELVLLSTASPDYEKLTELNNKRFNSGTIKPSELKPGYKYLSRSNVELVYMGRFEAWQDMYHFDGKQFQTTKALERYAEENEKSLFSKVNYDWDRYNVYRGDKEYALFTYGPGCLGLRHFFYDSTAYEWQRFKILKSISGQLIDIVSDGPVPEYAELMDNLEKSTMYSPYDPEKDVVGILDDFMPKNAEYMYSTSYLTVINGEVVQYRVSVCRKGYDKIEGYTCSFDSRHKNLSMKEFFPHTSRSYSWDQQMIPVPLEEIFKKLPPYYVDQYLKNGKYYRRITNYGY